MHYSYTTDYQSPSFFQKKTSLSIGRSTQLSIPNTEHEDRRSKADYKSLYALNFLTVFKEFIQRKKF